MTENCKTERLITQPSLTLRLLPLQPKPHPIMYPTSPLPLPRTDKRDTCKTWECVSQPSELSYESRSVCPIVGSITFRVIALAIAFNASKSSANFGPCHLQHPQPECLEQDSGNGLHPRLRYCDLQQAHDCRLALRFLLPLPP